MTLGINNHPSTCQSIVQPLPIRPHLPIKEADISDPTVSEKISVVASNTLTTHPHEDRSYGTPAINDHLEKENIIPSWRITELTSEYVNTRLKAHLQNEFISKGYRFAVFSAEAKMSDAIALHFLSDKQCDLPMLKDGAGVRQHAIDYIKMNKDLVNREIADQLEVIASILKNCLYRSENQCKATSRFYEILGSLPSFISGITGLYAQNKFRHEQLNNPEKVAKIESKFNKLINECVSSYYLNPILTGHFTADELLLWIMTKSIDHSITVWAEFEDTFVENHFCAKGKEDHNTLHLIQMTDGYGVLLAPKDTDCYPS